MLEIIEDRGPAAVEVARRVVLAQVPAVGDAVGVDRQGALPFGRRVERLDVEPAPRLVDQHLLERTPLEHPIDRISPVGLGRRSLVEPEPIVVRHRRSA